MSATFGRIALRLRHGLVLGLLGSTVMWGMGGFWGDCALGYVPKGPQVLDLVAGQLSGAPTLRVEQQVTVEDQALFSEPVELSETLNYIFPTQFRSDTIHQDSRRIHVESQGQALTVVDKKISATPVGSFDAYKDLLLHNTTRLLHKTLAMHDVDVGICSLGHQGEQVVWVIGAHFPDESVSQVWVDQEQFLPLRWLSVRAGRWPGESADRWEFLYASWQKVDGVFYPFRIETFHNGQRIRLIRVTKVDANAIIDKELFDIAHLQSLYQTEAEPVPPEKQPTSDVDDVERTIEEFKKKFEP